MQQVAFQPARVNTQKPARFGVVLRRLRTRAGLSQERMALESGLDRTYISLLERGLRQPTLGTLFLLAGTLRTDASKMVAAAERELSKPALRRKARGGPTNA